METDTCGGSCRGCKCCAWENEFLRRRKFKLGNGNETFSKLAHGTSDDGPADEVNEGSDNSESRHISVEEDGDGDDSCPNDENIIRFFLKEEDDSQHYLDLLEEVGGFCQGTSLKHLQDGTKDNSVAPVAILHELSCSGHNRPYGGPLAQKQLYEKLCEKVEFHYLHPSGILDMITLERLTHSVATHLRFGQKSIKRR